MLEVSIIMPCYNQSEYVKEAINSVINQTFVNWELIIVNDGSTDNSLDVIRQHVSGMTDNRIFIYDIENHGVSYTRNFGIKRSTGKYLLPLDADDVLHPEFIQKALEFMNSDLKPLIVYSEVEFFGAKQGKFNTGEFSYKNILLNNIIVCTALFKRADFDKTDGYDTSFNKGWEDWDFWLSILELGGIAYKIPKTLFYYRIKEDSRNTGIDLNQDWQAQAKWLIFQRHIELYKTYFTNPISLYNEVIKKKNEIDFFNKKPLKYLIYKMIKYKKVSFF